MRFRRLKMITTKLDTRKDLLRNAIKHAIFDECKDLRWSHNQAMETVEALIADGIADIVRDGAKDYQKYLKVVNEKRWVKVDWDLTNDDGDDYATPADVGLAEVVQVPPLLDTEDITDWLSDEYGYCLFSWSYVTETGEELDNYDGNSGTREEKKIIKVLDVP